MYQSINQSIKKFLTWLKYSNKPLLSPRKCTLLSTVVVVVVVVVVVDAVVVSVIK